MMLQLGLLLHSVHEHLQELLGLLETTQLYWITQHSNFPSLQLWILNPFQEIGNLLGLGNRLLRSRSLLCASGAGRHICRR